MATLLLRLAGPMQSWGVQSRFSNRDTGREPSKSGVIGLVCAALGRARDASVDDIGRLRMGVRVDREGTLKSDFHTAQGVIKADASGVEDKTSTRFYLSDADFLVALEGDDVDFLRHLHSAIERPRWQLYLGRKSFVPGEPVHIQARPEGMRGPADAPGVVDLRLEEALERFPWTPRKGEVGTDNPQHLRVVVEAPPGSTNEVRPDAPLSFKERRFGLRHVKTSTIEKKPEPTVKGVARCISQG